MRKDVDPDVVASLVIAASDGLQTQWMLDETAPQSEALDLLARLLAPHSPSNRSEAQDLTVGTIYYGGSATPIHIEDRALAHLKVVIATKLRRNESFTVSWQHPDDQPRGRSTLWLHPSIPLRFVFDDPEPPDLSREWIEELASSANSSGGIMLIAEHFDTEPVPVLDADGSAVDDADGVVLGNVAVDHLEIDTLTVTDVSGALKQD